MTLPRGALLLERHVEKNGGTTFRKMLHRAEQLGHCMYWGYQQRSVVWQQVVGALENVTIDSAPPRVCIEAHNHIEYHLSWAERLQQLVALKRRFSERRIPINVHFHVRLREPLSYYLSFYLWIFAERQACRGNTFPSSPSAGPAVAGHPLQGYRSAKPWLQGQ